MAHNLDRPALGPGAPALVADDPERGPTNELVVVLAKVWQRKFVVLACILAGLLAAVVFLNVVKPTHGVEMRVTAAASSQNGIANRLGNLGGLAAIAGLPIGGSSKAEPFDLYLEALKSRELAGQLARDPRIMRTIFAKEWSARDQRWVRPAPGVAAVVKTGLGLGSPVWRAPDAARLQDYLAREILVTKNAKTPVTVVEYDAVDPQFGVYLLTAIDAAADRQIRSRALRQAVAYRAYLAETLPTVALAEVRRSLADALSEQFETIMMASSDDVPYAAVSLGTPAASVLPTKPKITIVLAVGLIAGLMLGVIAALVDFPQLVRQIRFRRA